MSTATATEAVSRSYSLKCSSLVKENPHKRFTSELELTTSSEFVVAQYSKQAIQEYIKLHTLEFERHEFDVVISWGGDVARKVQVSPFTPSPESVAQLTYLARDGRDLGVESLPVGLANDDVFTEQDFLDLLESNLESGNVLICASPRHSSSLSLSVLQAISQFHNSTEVVCPSF